MYRDKDLHQSVHIKINYLRSLHVSMITLASSNSSSASYLYLHVTMLVFKVSIYYSCQANVKE